jgi:hypothetical protein|tara:strand:+ start:43 stop:1662 length:1620 start_codon:yes stop_codon:yes gene_type:complete
MAFTVVDQGAGGDDNSLDNSFVTRTELFTILKQISDVSKFYELEVFEVLDVFREGGTIQESGEVKGRYLTDSPKEKITTFKPLNANILQMPVVGELWLGLHYTIGDSNPYYIGRVGKDLSLVNDGGYYNESAPGEERAIDTLKLGQTVLNSNKLFKDYKEGVKFKNISPQKLVSFEGDTIIQGRFGNTIRLGSNQNSGIADSPNIKIVSGLFSGGEDLDDDASSIYLTSREVVDYANPSFSVMDSAYDQPQITIDSNRLVFNAKTDVIGMFAQKDINIQSVEGDVAINAKDKITLRPKESTIEFDIKESGNGQIVNLTKEGIPFPDLNMAGFLKQTMGIQKLFQAFTVGVPKLSNPVTLPSGVKDIVKGLEGAKNFVEATLNLEFLEQNVLTTKTIGEIKASLPIPASLLNVVGDIDEFSQDIEGAIQKAENFKNDNEAKLERANQISAGIDAGDRKDLLAILENIPAEERDQIPGANDALAIAQDKSVGGGDIPRARENGVFRLLEDYIAEQGSVEGDVEQLKMYGKILNLTNRSNNE